MVAFYIGKMVCVRTTAFFTATGDVSTSTVIATLPAEYAPPTLCYFMTHHLCGGLSYPCLIAIHPSTGNITAEPFNWNGAALASKLYLNFHYVYML